MEVNERSAELGARLAEVKRDGERLCQELARFTTDMEFVKKFTPLDFQAKNFTPSISPNGENGEIYTAGKNFTLPPALTALTNSTSCLQTPAKRWGGRWRQSSS